MSTDMLNDLHHRVEEAASLKKRCNSWPKGERFDLLVPDHLMPEMNGADLTSLVRCERPGCPHF